MNHAISNTGSLEADYYRRETMASVAHLAQERREFRAEQILDAFDGRDVSDALELAGDKDPDAYLALCDSLAHVQHIPIHKITDRRLRDMALALDKVARYYAGHRAAGEVS